MMAEIYVCLLVLNVIIKDVGAINAPDNRGTEFIIGFMQNYNDPDREPMDNELFITTSKTTPTNVLVQAPRYPSLGLNESFSVIAGTVKQLNIKSDIRLIGTSMEAKGILVTSDQEIVVYGVNKDRYSNDAYVSLPTDVLGTDYFAVCWYPQTRQCQILIAATQDNTTVAITLGPGMQARRNPVTWQGTNYYRDDTITVTMDRLDTFQITNEDEDLTGSRITSDKPISVFSGNQKTIISSGTSSDHLVEQLTPVNTWGKRFATVPIPERTVGDMFKFVASEDNTQVSINCNGYSTTVTLTTAGSYHIEDIASDKYCYVTADKAILTVQFCKSQTSSSSSEKSDPMMMLIPPVELYGADYTFSTPKYSQGSYENFFMFTIKDSLKDGLLLDGEPFPASTVYNSITGINLVAGYVPVTDGSHVIRHTSTIAIFGGYLYGKAPYETYGFSTGTRLASINGVCINTTTVVGDGLDNDCDGLIDEENCMTIPAVDDDGDGLFDEDCAIPFPVNGNWSEWSSWSFCSVNCTMIRSRTCTNPAPAYDGEQCSGNSTDESDCTPCTGEASNETTSNDVTTTNHVTTSNGVTTTSNDVTTSNHETTSNGFTSTNHVTTSNDVMMTNNLTMSNDVITTKSTNSYIKKNNRSTLIDILLIGLLTMCVLFPCCCSLLVYCVRKRCKKKKEKKPEKERLPSPVVTASPFPFTKKNAWHNF